MDKGQTRKAANLGSSQQHCSLAALPIDTFAPGFVLSAAAAGAGVVLLVVVLAATAAAAAAAEGLFAVAFVSVAVVVAAVFEAQRPSH